MFDCLVKLDMKLCYICDIPCVNFLDDVHVSFCHCLNRVLHSNQSVIPVYCGLYCLLLQEPVQLDGRLL